MDVPVRDSRWISERSRWAEEPSGRDLGSWGDVAGARHNWGFGRFSAWVAFVVTAMCVSMPAEIIGWGSGAVVGLVTGVVSASTGVQVMPSVPYLQATGMEKDELIQAMGVFFTFLTLALSVNVRVLGLATLTNATPVAVAFICAFAGIFIGPGRAVENADGCSGSGFWLGSRVSAPMWRQPRITSWCRRCE